MEKATVVAGRSRDAAAGERLLQEWEPLVRRMAGRLAGVAEREDLEQTARLALWQAAQRFDPERGCQFSTFAVPTIMGSLRHHLRDRGPAVGVPRRWWELRSRLRQVADALAQALGREPSIAEMAAQLGASEQDVVGAMAVQDLLYPRSLEDLQGGPEGEETEALGDRLGALDPWLEAADLRIMLAAALDRLAPRLRRIIERRYFQGFSQQEVARQECLSQMQISRLERRALDWLRQELREA
jgi:RNA polymerase sigma-B factor